MDLLDGQVVRAVAGERSNYKPIRSALAGSAEPAVVMRALLGVARFRGFYIADLDAIMRAGSDRHFDLLTALCRDLAAARVDELWLDAGTAPWLAELGAAAAVCGVRLVPVLGSESLADDSTLVSRMASLVGLDCVLSLDYRGGKFLGPVGLDRRPEEWPRRVVVMELAAVGVGGGPALACLDRITASVRDESRSDIAIYAAGGVRNAADLRTLKRHGVRGALLASALHDARIDAKSLSEFIGAA
jgi:phosphoribosylformimino-5-aminoimidazole carboxamide ribotide isomerase